MEADFIWDEESNVSENASSSLVYPTFKTVTNS